MKIFRIKVALEGFPDRPFAVFCVRAKSAKDALAKAQDQFVVNALALGARYTYLVQPAE